MRPRWISAVLLSSALPLAAQDPPKQLSVRAFLPAEHTVAIYADMKALVDSDIWDAIERSPAKVLLGTFRRNFGYDLADVERFDAAIKFHPDADERRERQSVVLILAGNKRVGTANLDFDALGRYEAEVVGGQEVFTGSEPAIMSLRPGQMIFGDSHHLLGVLEGQVRGGVPAPELMPLTAGGKALAYFAMLATDAERDFLDLPFLDPEDPAEYVAARLVQRPKDGHLILTARMGFEQGDKGPATLGKAIDEGLAHIEGDARFNALRPVLGRLERRQEEKEYLIEIDLGEPREAASAVVPALVIGALAPMRVARAQADAAAAEVERMTQRIKAAQERARKALEGKKDKEKKGEGK